MGTISKRKRRSFLPASSQLRYAAAYILITAAALFLLNLYASTTIRSVTFHAQADSLESKAQLLDACYADRRDPMVAFAGQMTGVEGYVESCASGYLAAVSMAARLEGRPVPDFGTVTAIGALAHYVSDGTVASFQPMNVNFGIIAPLEQRVRGKANKNLAIANRSLAHLEAMEK